MSPMAAMLTDDCDPLALETHGARRALKLGARLRARLQETPPSDGEEDPYAADRRADLRERRALPPASGIRQQPFFRRALAPAARLALPWRQAHPMLKPVDAVSLSRWQPTDAEAGTPCRVGASTLPSHAGPRLCVACMLRAVAPPNVDGFLRYYHGIGFEVCACQLVVRRRRRRRRRRRSLALIALLPNMAGVHALL